MQDSYREIFITESIEYLKNINKCLVRIEKTPSDLDSLNEIFRCVHTLKGMSATMGFDKLTQLSHQMEDLLDELRNQKKRVTSEIIDILFVSTDLLEKLVEEIRLNQPSTLDISEVISSLKETLDKKEEEKKEEKEVIPEPELKDIEFTEEELKVIRNAKAEGFLLFRLKVFLSSECAMKGTRAYLVIINLEKLAKIIKSIPKLEDLEEGKFNLSFILIGLTKHNLEFLRKELMNMVEVEEVIIEEMALTQPSLSSSFQVSPSYIKKIETVRIPVERLDKIMNLMGELIIAKIRLMQLIQYYKIEALEEVAFTLDRLSSSLQDEIMQTRLIPIAYILDTFPRVVRDLAKNKNKEIDLEVIGSGIELDRVILNEIGDPLIHLVRNAVDHGIESPEERKKIGKPPKGKLIIKVLREKGQIFIEVSDDGRGVDFEAVRKVAVEKGLVSKEEADKLDNKSILDLICLPGFSTTKKITDISGRGVGLDVVKSKIDSLGGRLDFESQPNKGTKFILALPLTLAIIKAMLVKVRDEIFAIPLMNIRETIKLDREQIKFLQNFEVIRVRDEIIPLIRLDKEFGLLSHEEEFTKSTNGKISVVIVEYGQKSLGLTVNQILGEQDIVVKPLTSFIKKTKGIAGATVLGDGKVALILDIMSLR
ncbi:MAG: chemotaxis protein CheA [Candidatus Omnitrophica bacterium]|nr:chemotaxis protein CheA [Candidatus Omnitrophota bacterium]